MCSAPLKCRFLFGHRNYTREQSPKTAKRLWELLNHPNTSCSCCGAVASCRVVLVSPSPSLSPHVYRPIKAALEDYDWQNQPIPSANHPQGFQGLGAVVMSCRQCGVTHRHIPAAPAANSEISCILLTHTPQWLISCFWRICIICHCTVGPPPF